MTFKKIEIFTLKILSVKISKSLALKIKIDFLRNRFIENLINKKADWSVCAGNWNWIASGDPIEVLNSSINFCPISHGKKVDPDGKYIR